MTKRIVILGAGESGTGAALLAKSKGFDTFVSDSSVIKATYKEELNKHQILWEEGMHSKDLIFNADEVIKSPGIPDSVPIIQSLKTKKIPIISEIEFAGRYSHAKMICITGSNGKTTTTSLLYHIFETANKNVGLAGNIGRSLARQVIEDTHDYYIIELSSFQLDNMYKFKADIAVLLNITPDHLDRYNYSMDNYIDAKFRITQNQTESDHFIYWADDPILKNQVLKRKINATSNTFSATHHSYTYANESDLVINNQVHIKRECLKLYGTHNLYNTMAAITAAYLCKISEKDITTAITSFSGVEHRLEPVAIKDKVQYINDSKATNVDSCWYALQAMTTPVILILGGKDKGNDYNKIAELVRNKCKGLVFLGLDNQKLHSFFDSFNIPIKDTRTMNDAVYSAKELAQKGYTVLLSPCCASFDLFTSYENRGNLFKQSVKAL